MGSINNSLISSGGQVTTFTPLQPPHEIGDFLLTYLLSDFVTPVTISPAPPWTKLTSPAATGNIWDLFAYTTATTTNESFTANGPNVVWAAIAATFKDVDSTNPIHMQALSETTTGLTLTSPALTTLNDGCILVYGCSTDGNTAIRTDQNDLSFIDTALGSNTNSCVLGWQNQMFAGAVPQVTWTRYANSGGMRAWVLALNNSVGGGLRGEVLKRASVIKLNGSFDPGNFSAPDTKGVLAIDGDGMSSVLGLAAQSLYTINMTSSQNVANVPTWCGGWDTFASPVNLSGKIISLRWQPPGVISGLIGTKGIIVVLMDSVGNWKAFTLGLNAQGQMSPGVPEVSYIDVDDGVFLDSSGGFDNTAVVHVGYFQSRIGTSTNATSFPMNPLWDMDGIVFASGNGTTPALASDIAFGAAQGPSLTAYGWGLKDTVLAQGTQQILLPFSCQFGNGGTTITNLNLSGSSIETPSATDYLWNVSESKILVSLYAGVSDTFNLSSGILRANTRQRLTINPLSSMAANYNFVGRSFFGWDIDWLTGVPCNGASFSGCYDVDLKGASQNNNTVTNPKTSVGLKMSEAGATLTGCVIDVTGTAADYHLELGTAVTTISLIDTLFNGTPTVDKIHVLRTTGTVTITVAGTTNIVLSDVTSDGATVVLDAPQVYQEVALTGLVPNTQIQLYDLTSNTELDNALVPGSVHTWTDPNPAAASRNVRLRMTNAQGVVAYKYFSGNIGTVGTTETTASIRYLANQELDTVYNTNAVDGTTVADVRIVEGPTDLFYVNRASGAITWAEIYAYMMTYLYTPTGIQDDPVFIVAKDTANYSVIDTYRIHNEHPTVALTISGGYGVDENGSASALYDQSGNSIFPDVEHVVAYQTSGSYIITGDISTVLTAVGNVPSATLAAAAADPISADIQQVLTAPIDGDGSDPDPWGPV